MSLMGALAVGVAKGPLIRIKVLLDLTQKIRREREGGREVNRKERRKTEGCVGGWGVESHKITQEVSNYSIFIYVFVSFIRLLIWEDRSGSICSG